MSAWLHPPHKQTRDQSGYVLTIILIVALVVSGFLIGRAVDGLMTEHNYHRLQVE